MRLGRRARLRQPHANQHALAFAGTAGPDAAAVLLDDIPADIEAQAHARDLPLLGIGGPTERLEDALGRPRRQTDPAVLDLEQHTTRFRLQSNPQLRTGG